MVIYLGLLTKDKEKLKKFQDSFHFIDNKRRQSLHTYYIQPSRHPDVKAEQALKVPGEEVKSHPFTMKPKQSGYSSYRESEKDLLLYALLPSTMVVKASSESAFRLALGIVQKENSQGKTPIYRVWDLFQLGDCLVFLAFLYYAFHRELLNSLVLVTIMPPIDYAFLSIRKVTPTQESTSLLKLNS